MTSETQPVLATAANELLGIQEVSTEFNIPEPTLRTWRAKGAGPRCARLNGTGRLVYRRRDIEAWLDAQFSGGAA